MYASKHFPRLFYVEHADFSIRPFRLDDAIRALQLTEIYIAQVVDYNESVDLGLSMTPTAPTVQEPQPGMEPPGFQVLRNVHISNTTTFGKWFFFDATSSPGFSFSDEPVGAQQFRGSSLVWHGEISLWNSRNGFVGAEGSCAMCNAHGRRASAAAEGQWQVGDVIHLPRFHQSWAPPVADPGRAGASAIVWVVVALLLLLVLALLGAGLLWALYVKEQYTNRVQKIQLDHYGRAAAGAEGAGNSNVVVGKPVGSGGVDESAEGEALGPGPVTCRTPTKARSRPVNATAAPGMEP